MDNLYGTWHDALDGFILGLEEDYGEANWNDERYKEFDIMAYDYFLQLSAVLARFGVVRMYEMYQMLDDAGF